VAVVSRFILETRLHPIMAAAAPAYRLSGLSRNG
jgi:hypothetical protein